MINDLTRQFRFIRHGESESNAGLKTLHPQSVQLTDRGHDQARQKAAAYTIIPDLFITSGYCRAQQTAHHFTTKFPSVPIEEWNIHEFTYLDPVRYQNTTNDERAPYMSSYWKKCNPHYRDADGSETFFEFSLRCTETIKRIRECQAPLTVAFSHGYLIKGVIFALEGHFNSITDQTMHDFWQFHTHHKIENCAELCFEICNDHLSLKYPINLATHHASDLTMD